MKREWRRGLRTHPCRVPVFGGEWTWADLLGWHRVANATLKESLATPAATPFGSDQFKEKLWPI